ncbi:dual specificity protein phosphatase family protein [Nocardiopsis sp. EMB25]|uniref:dual specificity protein phosphatase family protein n=1 Tax=Nocardiopsis sp. EMB25 TaxID=2835867 RepID=UPI00228355A0|nr:dual specificity protein phosphatase family protein [Nocardiopsis sp. EMB25]MCY9783656.1 dual specificity protein phosphatase family protein [Nocardiopsis sp. EMB25]
MTATAPLDIHDPLCDRAVGALLGAATAAALVEAPPALTTQLTGPAPTTGPARLAHLVHTALTNLTSTDRLPEPPPDPTARAWAHTLRATTRTGTPPAHAPDLEHTPADNPLGASWHALTRTARPHHDPAAGTFACTHLVDAIRWTRTTHGDLAAMHTGALAGALWGASAVPLHAWRRLARTLDPHTLVVDALRTTRGTHPHLWPETAVRTRPHQRLRPFAITHPLDPGVLLANLDHLREHPHSADAAVSLCATHPDDAPHLPSRDWVRVWLHDRPGANQNLHHTLDEAAAAVAALRAEGKRVLLHCWAGASRTPAVAARYAVAALGAPTLPTLARMIRAVGGHLDNPTLARAVAELDGQDLPDPAAALFPDGVPPRRPELPKPQVNG